MSTSTSAIDVHDLAKEKLPAQGFPVRSRSDFRLYMTPEVHRGTWNHAKKSVEVEICGVLVGRWHQDDNGPYALVNNYISCEGAASKFAEVTFTHESWAQINKEMDTRFADERIIGWYHSHPDFGVFLSDRDCFIQQHFFSGPGQVAYVIDPVRDLEGVFAWRDGKPTPLPYFWVGDAIHAFQANPSAAAHAPRGPQTPEAAASLESAPPSLLSSRQGMLDLALMLLSWVGLFLLGYFYSGLQSKWQQDMVVQGTVAHYGLNKLIKLGMEEKLTKVRAELALLTHAVGRLPEPAGDAKDDQAQAVAELRKGIINNLTACQRALDEIQQQYAFSDEERAALFNLMLQKQAELRKLSEAATVPSEKPAAGKDSPKSDSTGKPSDASQDAPGAQNDNPAAPK